MYINKYMSLLICLWTLTNCCYDYDGIEQRASKCPLRFAYILVAIPAIGLNGGEDLFLKVGQMFAHIRHPIVFPQDQRIIREQPDALGEIEAQILYIPLHLDTERFY